MEKSQPNYYAIVPASVRYSDKLIPSAKLLYGEITALSNEKGFCWASDGYFQNLYGVGKSTIQRWLKSLEDASFIEREVIYKEGSAEIEHRYIRIRDYPIPKNGTTPIPKNGGENTTSFNTTVNNTNNIKDIVPPKKTSPAKQPRHKYGIYQNVLLSDLQVTKLKSEFPNDWEERIERLSEYIASSGKVYSNFLATIRNWAKKDTVDNNNFSKKNYQRPRRKETMPDWVDNPVKETPMSEEDQAKFRQMLVDMRAGGKKADERT